MSGNHTNQSGMFKLDKKETIREEEACREEEEKETEQTIEKETIPTV
jgi:hypothetical protein